MQLLPDTLAPLPSCVQNFPTQGRFSVGETEALVFSTTCLETRNGWQLRRNIFLYTPTLKAGGQHLLQEWPRGAELGYHSFIQRSDGQISQEDSRPVVCPGWVSSSPQPVPALLMFHEFALPCFNHREACAPMICVGAWCISQHWPWVESCQPCRETAGFLPRKQNFGCGV